MKSLAAIMFLSALVTGGAVQFTAAGVLQCNGERIDVGSYAAPLAVDWDGDGKKDLITGQFDGGMIRFYPNSGSDDDPQFQIFYYLMDGAAPLSVPYG